MTNDVIKKICDAKIVAVVVFEAAHEVEPTVEALLAGGVQVMELALRSPYALAAAQTVRQKYPEMLLGIGTILKPEQAQQVQQLGADFGVAPGLNRRVVEAAMALGLPFFPGISTASEVEAALEYDIRLLKFFPAEPIGGLNYLQSLHAPYAHLGLRYIPLGGVNPQNLSQYLSQSLIGAVGGSWIASRQLIGQAKWSDIRQLAGQAVDIKNAGQ